MNNNKSEDGGYHLMRNGPFVFGGRRFVIWVSVRQWIFVLFLGLILLATPSQSALRECQKPVEDNTVETKLDRYVIDDSKQVRLPLTLLNSDRISHRLTNAIFKKFIMETVGYRQVQYVHVNKSLSCKQSDSDQDMIAMIDLEVWIPPGYSDNRGNEMNNLGSQGTAGRFGWFVKAANDSYEEILDHWRYFRREEVGRLFALDEDQLDEIKRVYTMDKNGEYFCTSSRCVEGIYTPELCKGETICAMLFAGEYLHSKFLPMQIDQQKLLVQVVWIGTNLTPDFVNRFRNGRPIVYFSFWPNTLSIIEGLHQVSFPSYTEVDPELNNTYLCKYELHTLRKYAWSKLQSIAVQAYETVLRFSLRDSDYKYLLKEYNRMTKFSNSENLLRINDYHWDQHIIDHIADEWMAMSSNAETIYQWRPQDFDAKPKLWIAGIFPLSEDTNARYSSKTLYNAAELAICDINSNSTILKDYNIVLKGHDGGCASDVVLYSYIHYIRTPNLNINHLVGILGPSCSDTVGPLAGISRLLKTVIISYSAEGAIFNDQEKYPYFFRTIPENKIYRYVYLQLFKKLQWKKVASLTEDGNRYSEYLTLLQDVLTTEKIHINNRKFPKDRTTSINSYLQGLKTGNNRIIIGDFYSKMACEIFCEAFKLNMTAKQGYVWFIPRWFEDRWYDTDKRLKDAKNITCSTEDMLKAIDGHLSLGYAYYLDDDVEYHSGNTVGDWKSRYFDFSNATLADYAGYTYDAVWTYAFALNKLMNEDIVHAANMHSENTTARFVELLRQTNFMGVSGHISFKANSSRKTVVNIFQFDSNWETKYENNPTNETKIGEYRIVGIFTPNLTLQYDGTLELDLDAIKWLNPGGEIPSDGSPPKAVCVFAAFSRLLGLNCELTIVITMLIAFVVFVIMVLIGLIYKTRYGQIEARDLGMDEWEIPRERVVINRTIGAGAFGTVYGGECRIKVDGPWDAVAVKTLKVGSDSKFDFLNEAIMMKEFNHKNIVKLLGLATLSEPIYMIMEFMLYGDLKTYLLARRHLVSERTRYSDNHEISNRYLTSMALDVACALDYLATNKYIHRDVACRNCLVNADRVIKLSDFGMTRPLYESNYYRYSRKGMLPVRWMAKESIEDGVYTTMTDVWSFGVLLYEIITFGNFPFQGLTNEQVLESVVKQGNTIRIPHGIRPPLTRILRRCWMQLPDQRPTFGELMEIFTNSPRLIEPCLEVPTASVQTDEALPPDRALPSNSLREVSPDQNLDTVGVFSVNSVAHCRRPRNIPDAATIEPLLPGDSYVTRYTCLQLNNKSPEFTDYPPLNMTTV